MSAAIEIYNKPVIEHREETFSMLACSAWELLLKARLVQAHRNKMEVLFEKEPIRRKDGSTSARKRVKRNAAGNPVTISLRDAIGRARALHEGALDERCAENIGLLSEVRNNAVHFVNEDRHLAESVHGLAAASVRNYVRALADWFNEDLASRRFAILPLSFEPIAGAVVVPGARRSQMAMALQRRIEAVAANAEAGDGPFAISLRVDTRMVGARQRDAIPIRQGRGPGAAQVEMNDEMLLERYPLRYTDLCRKLREQLPGLKVNRRFHAIKQSLEDNPAYVYERRLQSGNPRTPTTKFYSNGMVDAFVARLREQGPQPEALPDG
jgi:hypothetical protein